MIRLDPTQEHHPIMTTLRGPADPDRLRRKVGRYNDRWYCDPLPTCAIAPATNDAWPAVSTLKKAFPKHALKAWGERTVAEYAVDNLAQIRGILASPGGRAAAVDVVKGAPYRDTSKAADRGTTLHALLEARLAGQQMMLGVDAAAEPYVPAIDEMLATLQPELVMAEVVVISRPSEVAPSGYGGTFDHILRIGGELWLTDLKTRKPGKWDDVYDDEAAQLAAYGRADYAIVERDSAAVRLELPPLAHLGVIAIAPDGWRLHEIDVAVAERTFSAMADLWDAMRAKHVVGFYTPAATPTVAPDGLPANPEFDIDEDVAGGSSGIDLQDALTEARIDDDGQAAAVATVFPGAEVMQRGDWVRPDRTVWIKDRVRAIVAVDGGAQRLQLAWPIDVPGLKDHDPTDDEIDLVAEACTKVEAALQMPFGDTDPKVLEPPKVVEPVVPPAPSPKVAADDPRIAELGARLEALPPDLRDSVLGHARRQLVPRFGTGQATEAHLDLVVGLIEAGEHDHAERRALAAAHVGSMPENVTADAAVGWVTKGAHCDADRLTADEVEQLGSLADALELGHVALQPDGTLAVCALTQWWSACGGKRHVLAHAKHLMPGRAAELTSSAVLEKDPPALVWALVTAPVPTTAA